MIVFQILEYAQYIKFNILYYILFVVLYYIFHKFPIYNIEIENFQAIQLFVVFKVQKSYR